MLGKPLVNNAFRGTSVEAILAGALEPAWRWCADGWGNYDFEGPGALGLEVKQSAALQDWHVDGSPPNWGRFDIAARKGSSGDKGWQDKRGRFAMIYLFAWHPICDVSIGDHRLADQWEFYVVAASALPDQKSIGLGGIKALAEPVSVGQVLATVERLRLSLNWIPRG